MKKKSLLTALICSCFFCSLGFTFGQSNEQDGKWFKVKKVADKTWCITDNGIVNMYLIEGNKKALLIDNGYGVANLRDLLKSITELPITLVLTHGHRDHSGAACQFSSIYVHPSDSEFVKYSNLYERRKITTQNILKDFKLGEDEIFKDTINLKPPKFEAIKDGYVFDLGGRKLKVIEVPGHTQGSVALLDASNKMLFSGDHINRPVWIFLNGCLPVETYLKSLEKIKLSSKDFTKIYPGHNEPLDAGFLDELITCCKSVLDGTCKGEKYTSSAGDALQCSYKRALLAFNPDNLFVKK